MQSTTTEKVSDSLEEICSRHGIATTLKSDNGPQFVNEGFKTFCEENGIKHKRTTARWAQGNSEVERQNATLLKRLRIAQAEGKGWQRELRRYLLQCRAIPHSVTGKSPAELLYNRQIQTKMPRAEASHDATQQRIWRSGAGTWKGKQHQKSMPIKREEVGT